MLPRIWDSANGYHSLAIPGISKFQGQPLGVTVHYTASGSLKSAINSEEQTKLGYHFIIDRDGSICQTCYLDLRVNHAGNALWNGVSPNAKHIAVALVSWGLLDKDGRNYVGKPIAEAEIRVKDGEKWHACTPVQETALIKILSWLAAQGVDRKNHCGHDECCIPPGRKVDPGGVLSFTLADWRQKCM